MSIFRSLQRPFSKSHKHFSATSAATTTTAVAATPISQSSGPSEIEIIVKKFKRNSRSTLFRRQVSHYEAVVRRLAAGKHFSAIENILEWQKKYKDSMAVEGFGVRLINLYGKAGMFDHAYKVFDELPQYNCPRTVYSFNSLLYACLKSKKFDKFHELFGELPEQLGIEPNVISYNISLNAFCESNDIDSVMKVVEKMEESRIDPNIVSFNTILEAYYKENRLAEAEEWWQRMNEKGVIADVRTYNSKLRSLIKNDRFQEASELVQKMVKEEVNLDSCTYNALIKGCVDKENLEEAKILHGKMTGDGCFPDHLTYEMLIPLACDKGDIDFALDLCKQAVALRVHVYESLMQFVLDALIEGSKIEEANELVALVNSSKMHRYTLSSPVT